MGQIGGVGALLTNLAHFLKLRIVPNVKTASRDKRVQNAAWPHLGRERGNLDAIRDARKADATRPRPGGLLASFKTQ